jgi:hypothetical protein
MKVEAPESHYLETLLFCVRLCTLCLCALQPANKTTQNYNTVF